VNSVIQLRLKKGESVERALKRLKKIMDKEGLLKQLRNNRYYEKPCEKARRKSARARIRNNSRRSMREMF
jgi:small subunit ribosomal protein S21